MVFRQGSYALCALLAIAVGCWSASDQAAAGQAAAGWTAGDQAVVEDSGFTAGMGAFRGFGTDALLESAAFYIGIHTTDDAEAAAAGNAYQAKMDEGSAKLAAQSPPLSLGRSTG